MARMRAVKQQLKDLLSAPDWRDHLPELRSMGQPAVGPLFSFLLLLFCCLLRLPCLIRGLSLFQRRFCRSQILLSPRH